jgi:mRNA interferase HicA
MNLKYLRFHGFEFIREGSRHSWWWNPAQNKRSLIPRHKEINDILAKKIYNALGIKKIK